jgi:predicted small metal-binding protein
MNKATLSCKDLGNRTCDFVATGESDAEVKRRMLEHASREHAPRNGEPGWKDELSRRIEKTQEERAAGGSREDASQGGEFLDDDVRAQGAGGRDDAEEDERGKRRDQAREEGGSDEGRNAVPGARVNVNPNDHAHDHAGNTAGAPTGGNPGRRADGTRSPLGEEDRMEEAEHVEVAGDRRGGDGRDRP